MSNLILIKHLNWSLSFSTQIKIKSMQLVSELFTWIPLLEMAIFNFCLKSEIICNLSWCQFNFGNMSSCSELQVAVLFEFSNQFLSIIFLQVKNVSNVDSGSDTVYLLGCLLGYLLRN